MELRLKMQQLFVVKSLSNIPLKLNFQKNSGNPAIKFNMTITSLEAASLETANSAHSRVTITTGWLSVQS